MITSLQTRIVGLLTTLIPATGLLLAHAACAPAHDTLPLSIDDDTAGPQIVYNDDPGSDIVATIAEPGTGLAMTVRGTKAADGSTIAITALDGTTADGATFSATLADNGTATLTLPQLRLEVSPLSDDELQVLGTATAAPKIAPTLAAESFDVRVLVDVPLDTLHRARSDCQHTSCQPHALRDLNLLTSLALIQQVYACVFNEKCGKTQSLDPQTCLALIGLAGGVGETIQRIIDSNPDLPAGVRAIDYPSHAQNDSGASDDNTGATDNDATTPDPGGNDTSGDDTNNGTDTDPGSNGTDGDTSDGGICGSYPADGAGLTNTIAIYGAYDTYGGQPVTDSNAAIYTGHYTGYSADGFYYAINDLQPADVEITWGIDGSQAALVPGSQSLNTVYVQAIEAGTTHLCVRGVRKDTGQVIGYRSVPITILDPPFFIDTVEVWRPEYVTPSNNIFLLLGHEGQVSLPVRATVETRCAPENGAPRCPAETFDAYDTSDPNVVSISMDLTEKCGEIGTGGTIDYRIYMRDTAGAYSRPLDYTYTCIPNP